MTPKLTARELVENELHKFHNNDKGKDITAKIILTKLTALLVGEIEKISYTTIEAYPKTVWVRKDDITAIIKKVMV